MSRAIRVFLNRELLVGLVIAVVASILIAPLVAHRFRIVRPAAYIGVLATLSIISITIFDRVEGIPLSFDLARAVTWWTTQRASVIDVARTEPGWLLNVVLFVPAGLVWSAITRRPLAVAVALGGLSFAIESLQGLTGFGASDVTDLVANTLGGVIGATMVAAVLKVSPQLIPDVAQGEVVSDRVRFDARWVIGSLVVTALATGAGLLGVRAVLASRQAALRDELEQVVGEMTLHDVNAVRALDPVNGRQFFDLVSIRPDSYLFLDDSRPVEVRYPVDFLGVYRCVFVTFSDALPVFVNGNGQECTEERYDDRARVQDE